MMIMMVTFSTVMMIMMVTFSTDDDHDGDLLDGAAFPPCDGDAIGLGDDGALLALLRDTLLKTS